MNKILVKSIFRRALAIAATVAAAQVGAQVTFFEHDDFQGRSFNPGAQLNDFGNSGFNET